MGLDLTTVIRSELYGEFQWRGASSCRRKASQKRVRFVLEFPYGRNLQRPKYR